MFVLSNATASLDWSFDYLGLRPYFNKIMISSYERCEKPNQEIYIRALSTFNINPETSLFIDDKIENVVMAKQCGIKVTTYSVQKVKISSL